MSNPLASQLVARFISSGLEGGIRSASWKPLRNAGTPRPAGPALYHGPRPDPLFRPVDISAEQNPFHFRFIMRMIKDAKDPTLSSVVIGSRHLYIPKSCSRHRMPPKPL
jgi:hypothetical protein